MAMLRRVEIKGYRSIKDAALDLRPLNVLIGANGAGKSNLVSFFKLLNEMMAGRLQEYIGRTGRGQSVLHFGPKVTPQLEASLSFEDGDNLDTYSLRLIHAPGDTLIFADEALDLNTISGTAVREPLMSLGSGHAESRLNSLAEVNGGVFWPAKLFQQILARCRVYHFHDTSPTARIRQFGYVNDNRQLAEDAGNLAAMLYAYRQRSPVAYKRIVSTARKILPEFDDFDLTPSRLNENDIILNWRKRGRDYLFGPHQLSDGSLRAMALCTLFLQPEADRPDVIILDEPELGLHPYALEIVAGLMRAVATTTQVIVATQSQAFLNHFAPSDVITAEGHDGRSEFHRLDPDQLKDWLDDYTLGELWQRNVLGGGPVP
jgi:predicted ATPase